MPVIVDDLSVWDISFRWAGLDPDRLWLRFPLAAKDNFRLLVGAILSGEVICNTLTLAKRPHDSKADPAFYIRTYIDEIYQCIHGVRYDRKLLKWATLDRVDFHEWCGRRGIPLPEFWFPPGWKLEFEMPEFGTNAMWATHVEPTSEGDVHIRYDHPGTIAAKEKMADKKDHEESTLIEPSPDAKPGQLSRHAENEQALRHSQRTRIACQQIARVIWKDDLSRTIASVVKDDLVQKYGGADYYQDETVREWLKEVAPLEVKNRRGRPRKNRDKDNQE